MSRITTHILDTAKGCPAQGIRIVLYQFLVDQWEEKAKGQTNADGRIADWPDADAVIGKGIYKMRFGIRDYFDQQFIPSFYPFVEISFEITTDDHYHIPLLISPFGYSTYRGS